MREIHCIHIVDFLAVWIFTLTNTCQRWRSSIQSAKTRLGADCSLEHKLIIAKFKKVGKTTRPFRYDLKQILYDYTLEATNRFAGLDLIERVPGEVWMEFHDTV